MKSCEQAEAETARQSECTQMYLRIAERVPTQLCGAYP